MTRIKCNYVSNPYESRNFVAGEPEYVLNNTLHVTVRYHPETSRGTDKPTHCTHRGPDGFCTLDEITVDEYDSGHGAECMNLQTEGDEQE
jgi:hypothetical protein